MRLTANGIDIHYTIEGEGPVVTMSHALGCNLALWNEQAKALSARYRVLRYDTRGHGASSAPPGPYSLEQMADDLYGLLTGLGVRQTHLVGISMGGMIGQIFALKYPMLLQSLVLCSTTSRYPTAVRSAWVERIRTVEANGVEPMVEPAIQRWFTPSFREHQPDVMDRVRVMLRSTPAQGYIGCCYAIPTIDVTDRLGEVHCPALVISGKEDPGTPVAMAQDIHAALPSSKLAILPSASHLCNLEQCEAFNGILLGFLDKVTG
ncbi:3-oxoadipate enol-lactonase [Candidatus Methylomirabilis sp.]|uniref:3-oxoadipate enol-lactonase n=1 Tax=Candidatus Methylomirabilis sp. TaxID=2032687 RepID=UPI002A63E3F1|nr:3-oxoadipate enol-lactonase [Candidatus Methylomirabilis sp.]